MFCFRMARIICEKPAASRSIRSIPTGWHYPAHAKTPLLLLQGEADRVDPLGQSEEMFRALRQMGDHGPLAMGIFGEPSPEPWHRFDGRPRIIKVFEKAFAR